jgi:hypothetical protein
MLGFIRNNSKVAVLGAAAFVLAAAAPAAALTVADFAKNADKLDGVDSSAYRFMSLSPTAAHMEGGTTFDDGAYGFGGMQLPDAGVPSFAYGITLPPDYKPGSRIAVRLLWHTPSTNCTIDLRPNATAVSRPGVAHETVGNASAGLTGPGPLAAPATPKLTKAATFVLTPPKATVNPLKPGDAYQFGIFRSAASGNDTCTGELHIDGLSVRY